MRRTSAIKKATRNLGNTCRGESIARRWVAGGRRSLRVHPIEGVVDQFGSAFQAELALDVFAVGFDGLDAQVQFVSNLARAMPLADQVDVAFAGPL